MPWPQVKGQAALEGLYLELRGPGVGYAEALGPANEACVGCPESHVHINTCPQEALLQISVEAR